MRCCDFVGTEVGGCRGAKDAVAVQLSVSVLGEAEAEDGECRNDGDLDGMCGGTSAT